MTDNDTLRSLLPQTSRDLLQSCAPAVLGMDYIQLLQKTTEYVYEGCSESVLSYCDILLDMAWEKLNTGYWKDVDLNWRYAYTVVSVLKVNAQYSLMNTQSDITLADVMKSCDMGLLMGAPLFNNILARMSSAVQKVDRSAGKRCLDETCNDDTVGKRSKVLGMTGEQEETVQSPDSDFRIDEESVVPRCTCPSLQTFKEIYMDKAQSVIIENAIDYWPAMSSRKWSIEYIKSVAGSRTVPVEIGSKYTDESWSQSLMTISDFIEHYIQTQRAAKGYLAQHQLFQQIPDLEKDISVPSYCCLGEEEDVDINAWFGPEGTVSPLHYDPKHNLLAQVIGRKYVRLYSDKFTESLYPHPDRLLINTAQVDMENPDHKQFPMFSKAEYTECILGPGEMLYIPPKHWHFVRSLAVSFSVSFWWE